MWQQTYTPIGNSLPLSALFAAIPIFALLVLLGVLRKPAWMASLAGLAAAVVVAAAVYQMPLGVLAGSVTYGAAFGLFPIGWVVFSAILLYRVSLESGKFEILKDSIGHLTRDRRLQALLIAFAFGAFIEGAAGFGTPATECSRPSPTTGRPYLLPLQSCGTCSVSCWTGIGRTPRDIPSRSGSWRSTPGSCQSLSTTLPFVTRGVASTLPPASALSSSAP